MNVSDESLARQVKQNFVDLHRSSAFLGERNRVFFVFQTQFLLLGGSNFDSDERLLDSFPCEGTFYYQHWMFVECMSWLHSEFNFFIRNRISIFQLLGLAISYVIFFVQFAEIN